MAFMMPIPKDIEELLIKATGRKNINEILRNIFLGYYPQIKERLENGEAPQAIRQPRQQLQPQPQLRVVTQAQPQLQPQPQPQIPADDADLDNMMASALHKYTPSSSDPTLGIFWSNRARAKLEYRAIGRQVLLRDAKYYWRQKYVYGGEQGEPLRNTVFQLIDLLQKTEGLEFDQIQSESQQLWIYMAYDMHRQWMIDTGGKRD